MKRILSVLLVTLLLASLSATPALAEDVPALDGSSIPSNVFYYLVYPGSDGEPVYRGEEFVAAGDHPSSIPTITLRGIKTPYTWYLTEDLSGDPVDPAEFTTDNYAYSLYFYGYLDMIYLTLHRADTGASYNRVSILRGSTFDHTKQFRDDMFDGYFPVDWADAEGNLLNVEHTPLTEDMDLYAVMGDFFLRYYYRGYLICGESFLNAGSPLHVPEDYYMPYNGYSLDTPKYTISGWTDERGVYVDPATMTVTEDTDLYAVLDRSSSNKGNLLDPGIYWSVKDGVLDFYSPPGAGKLDDCAAVYDQPWWDYRDYIKRIDIGEGITRLGDLSLAACYRAETLALPSTIETLGHDFMLLDAGNAHLSAITVADREGFTFDGWKDEAGKVFTSEQIIGGAAYTGDLTSLWKPASVWMHNSTGWWYRHADGSWPADAWEKIGGLWYHFGPDGYMQTGWLYDGGVWYYLQPSGAMATGWAKVGGSWYYLQSTGAMKTGWLYDDGTCYYLSADGAMVTGWQAIGGKWYFFYGSGAMAAGITLNGYVFGKDGAWIP